VNLIVTPRPLGANERHRQRCGWCSTRPGPPGYERSADPQKPPLSLPQAYRTATSQFFQNQ
jgi:hypothetical protein